MIHFKSSTTTHAKMWLHPGTTNQKKPHWAIACIALHIPLLPAARTPTLLEAYLYQDSLIQIKHSIQLIFLSKRMHVSFHWLRLIKLELQCGKKQIPFGQSKLYLLKWSNCLSLLTLLKLKHIEWWLVKIMADTPLTCFLDTNASKLLKHKDDSKSQW